MVKEAEIKELDYVVIREYAPCEYVALHDLYLDNWPKPEVSVFGRKIRPNVGRDQNERIFVAENNSQLVGDIFYCRRLDHVYLLNLVVREDVRMQGIAEELLKYAQEQAGAEGFDKVTINAEDDRLIEYYRHLGFVLKNGSDRSLVKYIPPLEPQQS
jgi:GNAT superfamily N-acetyltransferase